jgi:uncharacterized membrane protein HdeD (DUF308 family)
MPKLRIWWLLGIAGMLFVGIGIFCLVDPFNAYVKLVKYSGIALLINGLLLLLALNFIHISCGKEKKWMLMESLIDFTFGILLFYNPLLSFIVFPFLIGYCILFVGIIKIAASLSLKNDIGAWLYILVSGMLSAIFGILIIYIPFTRASEMTMFIAIFLVITGALAIFDSIRFRKIEDTLNLMF